MKHEPIQFHPTENSGLMLKKLVSGLDTLFKGLKYVISYKKLLIILINLLQFGKIK